MSEAFFEAIAQLSVCLKADFILEPGIGAHFAQSLRARPVFQGLHQQFAHPLPPQVFVYVPAFEITDRAGVTAIRIRAGAAFQKSAQLAAGPHGHKDRRLIGRGQQLIYFGQMFGGGLVGP